MPDDRRTDQIPTTLRLLLVMEEVARVGVPVTPTAVGEALGLPKPTVHRLLQSAEVEGFLQRDVDGRSYGPGPRLRRLSYNVLSSQRVRGERLRILKSLSDEVEETCNIATPDRDGMIYLDRVETHWPLRIQLPIGTLVPFHCTAAGKMYLSSLSESQLDRFLSSNPLERYTTASLVDPRSLRDEMAHTAQRGFATDDQEFMEGMTAIAVPVKDSQQRLMCTLSIHAPKQRQSVPALVGHLETLRKAAAALTALAEG